MSTSVSTAAAKGGAWLIEASDASAVFTPEKLTDEHRMIGQTAQIAPADKKLYPLRDVTAEVRLQALRRTAADSRAARAGRHDRQLGPDGWPRVVRVVDDPALAVGLDEVDGGTAELLQALAGDDDGQVAVVQHRLGGRHRLAELEVHVVGVIAVLDAPHGHPEHEPLGLRVVVPELYELGEGALRDREPVERRIVFAHLMASAADPGHRAMAGRG